MANFIFYSAFRELMKPLSLIGMGTPSSRLTSALDSDPSIVNALDNEFGMTLLHAACGTNNFQAVRLLVERGAKFVPDRQGRMPSIIAAETEASEALCDFILEAEAQAAAETPADQHLQEWLDKQPLQDDISMQPVEYKERPYEA